VGIDADSQKDLSLQDEDAEGVVGGSKKKKQQQKHKPAVHAANPPMVNVQFTPGSVSDAPPQDDCDPDDPSNTNAPV
jgi:hypothetical protein